MDKQKENKELLEDKAHVENLFSKQALANYEANQHAMPADYFEQFETQILNKTAIGNNVKRLGFKFPKWGQLAIAASFFTVVALTYIRIETNRQKNEMVTNITIQDIATTEIEAYVKDNEAIAEIDWQTEINKEGSNLEALNAHLIKDSNNSQ
jgi:hypothetical protein